MVNKQARILQQPRRVC